jgi:galactokinase
MVIAASIDMDTVAAAYPNGTSYIRIKSEGFDEINVDINSPESSKGSFMSQALVAGIVEGAKKLEFKIYGFDAYVETSVISGAGVSSSASFEMLILSIINYFFNDNAMSYTQMAKAGQYAENHYWGKSSGIMDQLACCIGGASVFDFSNGNEPTYEKLELPLDSYGYELVIVNTGKGHSDLSREYSGIPNEMYSVAQTLGHDRLCAASLAVLLSKLPEIKNDRAILRSIHFFKENERVLSAKDAIEKGRMRKLLELINSSGDSSWEYLQNCYVPENPTEQKISVALALTKLYLDSIGDGACRVHGGGFSGVIACILPTECADGYVDYISKFVGENNVYPTSIRSRGTVHIQK